MRYLSLDLEATGLEKDALIIELACVPFCTEDESIAESLAFHSYIKCPSFTELKPKLNPWVIENNKMLIEKAHDQGLDFHHFKSKFSTYLESTEIKNYFKGEKRITLFGKSMNAIDLPFLNRDLGENFMQKYFEHRYLDLSSVAYTFVDLKKLPPACRSGSSLMKHFSMGEVAHTALADAINTAILYFKILKS
jgi:oligoribonuclease (3'-5' exoribonuclease)